MTANTFFDYERVPAADLRKGDRLLPPDGYEHVGIVTLTDRPLRLRGRGVDQQWVTLRSAEGDIEVHEGDLFDRLIEETS